MYKLKVSFLFTVTVPTRRLDISIREDIIEEVGRYCDALTDFLRQIILSPSFQARDENVDQSETIAREPAEAPAH